MNKYITDIEQVNDALQYLKTVSVVGVDTETSGLDFISDKVLLLQIGDEHNQYVFDG